jgi:hypothetical protein
MSKEKYVGLPKEFVRMCAKYTIPHEPQFDSDFVALLSTLMPEWVGSARKKWAFSAIKEEASKFSTRREFRLASSAAYAAARKQGMLDVVCAHMTFSSRRAVRRWTLPEMFVEAKKYANRTDMRRKAPGLCKAAYRQQVMDKITAHMAPGKTSRWETPDLFSEALRFKTRNELKLKAPGAYDVLRRRGLLARACRHMPKVAPRRTSLKKAA